MDNAGAHMAVDDVRHILVKNKCEFLGTQEGSRNYPFRLIFFKEIPDQPKVYEAHSTAFESGLQYRGSYPLVDGRKDGFFGLVNVIENPFFLHEFNPEGTGDIIAVKVCPVDNPNFMRKGTPLRMPLRPVIQNPPTCECFCGDTIYQLNYFGIDASLGDVISGGAIEVSSEQVHLHTVKLSWQHILDHKLPATINYIEVWNYAMSFFVGVFSPQNAHCEYRTPPVFSHPKCPHFEMMEFKFVSNAKYLASYTVNTFLENPPTGAPWQISSNSQPQVGAKFAEGCFNIFGDLLIPENMIDSINKGPFNFSHDHDDFINQIPPGNNTLPPDGFFDINFGIGIDILGPFNRPGAQSCDDDCVCVPSPPLYQPC